MLFQFYCDESYDGSPPGNVFQSKDDAPFGPRTYVVAGILSDESTWTRVQDGWSGVNDRFEVSRFHASHLNFKTYEYDGWDDARKISYGKALLEILAKEGPRKLYAFTCGILADKYQEIISERGRKNLGHPYVACFNTCIARVADQMTFYPCEDKLAVILDRNRFQSGACDSFRNLKDNSQFPYHSRLATCTSGDAGQFAALQAADLIAYETFKRLHTKRYNIAAEMRKALSSLAEHVDYDGGNYFSEDTLRSLKPGIEAAVCRPNGLVVIPPQ